MTTCCFTGHRRIPPEVVAPLRERLEAEIESLIRQGVRYFGAGGALGFDTLAAEAVLDLKAVYPFIRLILVLPCRDQTRGWAEEDVKRYQAILKRADKVVYTAERYTSGCMYKRNRHLAEHSDCCLCYLTENIGGTFYTVGLCRRRGIPVRNLAEPAPK